MSRGLGVRQRAVLDALRGLDRRRRGHWWSPAEVLAALDAAARPAVVALVPEIDPEERMVRSQLAGCRQAVEVGHREYAAGVMLAERRLAAIVAAREAGERARADAAARAERARLAARYPNQRRAVPRGGEAINPARVFAMLARRGLVERAACRGPGSVVRIAPG